MLLNPVSVTLNEKRVARHGSVVEAVPCLAGKSMPDAQALHRCKNVVYSQD
jgi:hypothetical protein